MSRMNMQKILDPASHEYRVRYAIRAIMRDRIVNEAAFKNCLEMEDADEVVQAILRRGVKNPKLRAALRNSHLINLNHWLAPYPQLAEIYYYAPEAPKA